MSEIKIGRKDVVWNYVATFLKIGVGVILLPFILRVFPQETVAIWNIFTTIIAFSSLFDFGFNPSFARNVSYVISGVKELKTTGFQTVDSNNAEIDYGLLKGLINAMRWFYVRMAFVLFVVLAIAGTLYMHSMLKAYSGSCQEVYIAWMILIIINSYSFYTMYYDSLLQGMGLIKVSKQIEITGQAIYLIIAVSLILLHFNLIAIVSAQAFSIIIRRILSYKAIYANIDKRPLEEAKTLDAKAVLKPIIPNATKVGLNSLASFIISRSPMLLGVLFLSLETMASYGITMQIIGIISSIANIYFVTFLPQLSQQQILAKNNSIKKIYRKGLIWSFFLFAVSGTLLVLFGNTILHYIKSQTFLLQKTYLSICLLIAFYESFIMITSHIPLSKNNVPFYKISLIISILTLMLIIILLKYIRLDILGLIIAPGIAELIHWVWMKKEIRCLME